ncbi:MAG: pilin [Candidatus Saccharibacteria bacterium]
MIKKLKSFILVGIASLALGVPMLVPALASAGIKESLCQGSNQAAQGTTNSDCGTAGQSGGNGLTSIAQNIVNIFSIVVGIVAVIMIIYGGFKYITSGGDSGNVSSAKNTLIYAIIGLIIVALAQIIVHFVINTTASSTTGITAAGFTSLIG